MSRPSLHAISIGDRFGKLVVICIGLKRNHNKGASLCICDCGQQKLVQNAYLSGGRTKSCGCLSVDVARARMITHGESHTAREYAVWKEMRQRCGNPLAKSFADYGGRGITVCDRWQVYQNFLLDMGRCQIGLSINRINNDGNYEPGNCHWATNEDQANNRRSTRWFEWNGHKRNISQWGRLFGIRKSLMRYHLVERGRSIPQAAIALGVELI